MTDRFIPTIGATGFYNLSPPFTLPEGESYSCKAIRKISEHRSLGVDVFEVFYKPFSISEEIYFQDNAVDAEIISLLAPGGKWVNVPSRYMLGYPDMNGIPYHGLAFHVALPPFPLSLDTSFVEQQIKDVITTTLGVTCLVTPVEITRVSLVPSANHKLLTAKRRILSESSTPLARANFWRRAFDDLTLKYKSLEKVFIDLKP